MQYIKIKDAIVEQIDSGLLCAHQKLPSERQLSEAFNTTRITLREALSLLEIEGQIYREDRRGWFISPIHLAYDPSQNSSLMAQAEQQQRLIRIELLNAKSMLADKIASGLLQLPPFSEVFKLNRLHYLEARPVMVATHYIRTDRFPKLLKHDLTQILAEVYQEAYHQRIARVRYHVRSVALLDDIARSLRATSGSYGTLIERFNFNENDELISVDREYWRHDAISIESSIVFPRP